MRMLLLATASLACLAGCTASPGSPGVTSNLPTAIMQACGQKATADAIVSTVLQNYKVSTKAATIILTLDEIATIYCSAYGTPITATPANASTQVMISPAG